MIKLQDKEKDSGSRSSVHDAETTSLNSKRNELYTTIKSKLGSLIQTMPKKSNE